jgi:hypothetical protein
MSKLLTLPVVDEAENVGIEDVEALLVELLGTDFEDTVITDSGRTVYVAENVDQVAVNR